MLLTVLKMSLTLRDAQHVCWKNFRLVNDKLDPEKGKAWKPSATASELLEMVEELVSAVKSPNESKSDWTEAKEALAARLSSLLCPIFVLSEYYGIELEESFLQTANDYLLKFIK